MRATNSFTSDFASTAHLDVGNTDPRTAGIDTARAHKRRRTIQLGSSPPPFTTALQHHSSKKINRTDAALTSPKATRKRRVAAPALRNPLELHSSSPASPPPTRLSHAAQSRAMSEADSVTRSASRDLLQRRRQLDWSDPSSPIGTFGGQVVGRSDRNLVSSRFGSAVPTTLARHPKRTVGLPTAQEPPQARSRLRSKTRLASIADDENAEAPVQQPLKATKDTAEDRSKKHRRRRPKIQRVQLGNTPPSSQAANLPLSDADHQLNSQPNAAEHLQPGIFDAADESEISYFPTLRPARQTLTAERNAADTTDGQITSTPPSRISDHPPSWLGQDQLVATAPVRLDSERASGQDQMPAQQSKHTSEGDSSVGLLEVLSQSAMRKAEPAPITDNDAAQQQHQSSAIATARVAIPAQAVYDSVHVNFDPCHFTHAQVELIADSIVGNKSRRKQWTSVHPDYVADRGFGPRPRNAVSKKTVQAAWRPPSSHSVGRDLGLSSKQLKMKAGSKLSNFVHSYAPNEDAQRGEDEDVETFKHDMQYAGYRCSRTFTTAEAAEAYFIPSLQPFDAEALHKRMQSRRKEVVKIIVPFSGPSLSTHATPACFVAAHQSFTALGSLLSPSDSGVMLVWMQSTAQRFLHALETMLQASFARTAQTQSYRIDSSDLDLYPCPILHYIAHAGSDNVEGGQTRRGTQKKDGPSYVALYVHLDRIEEARQKLAALELGHDADEATQIGTYRPFSDPSLRLFVTSMKGEPLCLI